jgi:predicted nucleotidyltransferase
LNIPFCEGFELKIIVPRLEHLLSSKIAQSRAKDLMDNKNLSTLIKESNLQLDFGEMNKILMPYHEENYRRFLNLEYPSQYEKLKSCYE